MEREHFGFSYRNTRLKDRKTCSRLKTGDWRKAILILVSNLEKGLLLGIASNCNSHPYIIIRPETNTAAKLSLSSISWSTLQGLLNWRRCSLTKYLPPLWCVVGIFPKPLLPRQGECYKTVPHFFYCCCKSDETVEDCPE